jgi:hypothetical protein
VGWDGGEGGWWGRGGVGGYDDGISPYIGHGDKCGGPDRTTLGVGDGEVVAGGAVGINAELQTHVDADEASGWMELLPLVDAEG